VKSFLKVKIGGVKNRRGDQVDVEGFGIRSCLLSIVEQTNFIKPIASAKKRSATGRRGGGGVRMGRNVLEDAFECESKRCY
jgi:hypothetical protein